MSSNDSDRRDQRERGRMADAALTEDRQGRDRLIRLADEAPPSSHGDKSRDLEGARTDKPL